MEQLAAPSTRGEAALALARRLGAESLWVLIRDPAIGLLLPAPGFPRTLPGGSGWEQLIAGTLPPGAHPQRLRGDRGTEVPALVMVRQDTAFVFLGGAVDSHRLEELGPTLALLGALLTAEQRVAVAEGEAVAAREASSHAEGLTAALDLARRELETLLQDRERLISIVGHDLRNPLQAITMGVSMVLRRGGLTDVHVRSLNRVQASADRMGRMISGLMDLQRARAGTLVTLRAPGRLAELVQGVMDEFEVSHPERRLHFERLTEGEGLWAADRVSQLISNLIGNALQHSPEDAAVGVTVAEASGGEVTLEVHNQNRVEPIPPSLLKNLFQPFQRGRESAGLGLGLYIVRMIAEAHDGSVEVRSDPEGTLFRAVFNSPGSAAQPPQDDLSSVG